MILKPKKGERKSEVDVPENTNVYRVGHNLAREILSACKQLKTPTRELIFDYTNTPTKVTLLEKYIGQSGWLQVSHLEINSFEFEDHIITSCITEDGEVIKSDISQRLFSCNAIEGKTLYITDKIKESLLTILNSETQCIVNENAIRNQDFFDREMDKLDQWADDMKISLEKEIKDLDAEIKLKKSEAKKMLHLDAKVKTQRTIKELEKRRSEKRRHLFEAQDSIDERKENLLNEIEKRLNQDIETTDLFNVKWAII